MYLSQPQTMETLWKTFSKGSAEKNYDDILQNPSLKKYWDTIQNSLSDEKSLRQIQKDILKSFKNDTREIQSWTKNWTTQTEKKKADFDLHTELQNL